MDIKNPLIEWYIHRFHRLVQRKCCAGMIQTTRLVHHMFIKGRRDLVRLTIVYRPHRPNHRTEANKLHFCSVVEFDGSCLLARMRAVMGVYDEM